jgi:hypothetical protein
MAGVVFPLPQSPHSGGIVPLAFRVEYPPYKIQLNTTSTKIVGFKGNMTDRDETISISFVMETHSDYFAGERTDVDGIRVVKFEISDDCWAAIQWKATGKKKDSVKDAWVSRVEKLREPSWSDGSSLDTFTKKTALTFRGEGWLDALLVGVVKSAPVTVAYPEKWKEEKTKPAPTIGDDDEVWAYDATEGPAEGWVTTKKEAVAGGAKYMTVERAVKDGHKKY